MQRQNSNSDDATKLSGDALAINNPFVKIPQQEHLIFRAVRYSDVDMVGRLLRRPSIDISMIHTVHSVKERINLAGESESPAPENVDESHEATMRIIEALPKDGEPCVIRVPGMARHIRMSNYTLLHVAALHSSIKMIDFLLTSGADINACDGNDRTSVFVASAIGRNDVVEFLAQNGADLDIQTSSKKTALMEAVCCGNVPVVRTLIGAGANVNLVDMKGTSALFFANMSQRDDLSVLQELVRGGADVDLCNIKGASPLMMAAGNRHKKAVTFLLESGADINHQDSSGKTIFNMASENGQNLEISTILLHAGADIECPDKKGATPLMKAANFGKLRLMKLLLESDCMRDYSLTSHPRVQQMCEAYPDFGDWLNRELYNPRSLKRNCRQTLRLSLGPSGLPRTYELPLPEILKDFLLVKKV
ncbi:ankyrin repeat domain-containing protein 50-like isoform X2 [Gigantopelta aegis]|uniref:ankyrin repeat domain-containing protein 50-like isoform X2 n=1 Tax=Gigantopelta aegis TaxID=1735272 RepID=UPI001B88B161|nr:ankyrin repeat domain-containing protein 50-like isoform X2 [Gigantopelta aegis]